MSEAGDNSPHGYHRRVNEWVRGEVGRIARRIGVNVEVQSVRALTSDGIIEVWLSDLEGDGPWKDHKAEFETLQIAANERFGKERWYCGVAFHVPIRLLGDLGLKQRLECLERERDTVRFRSVRSNREARSVKSSPADDSERPSG